MSHQEKTTHGDPPMEPDTVPPRRRRVTLPINRICEPRTGRIAGSIVFLILLWLLVGYLFRGSYDYGMNADEVLRLLPFVSLVNEHAIPARGTIHSVTFGKVVIPVMSKSYISSMASAPLIPALFFDDWRYGLRLMERLYFFMAAAALFLVLQRFGWWTAGATSVLFAAAPYFYPEVRFGFISVLHVLLLAAAFPLLYRGYQTRKWRYGFLGGLLIGLGANMQFYLTWTLAGILTALLLLYPKECWSVLRQLRAVLGMATGLALGLVNFVVYNLRTGGATLRPLLSGLFARQDYNQTPIDYRILPSFVEEVRLKLADLPTLLGPRGLEVLDWFYLAIIAGVGALYAEVTVAAFARGDLRSIARRNFFPLLTVSITFLLILITPKSGRPGHWTFVAPFLQLTIVVAGILLYRRLVPLVGQRWSRTTVAGLGTAFFIAGFGLSECSARLANTTGGTYLFSPSIYEIHEDLEDLDKPGKEGEDLLVACVDWGFCPQLYFLSRGEAPVEELTYRLTGDDYSKAKRHLALFMFENTRSSVDLFFLFRDIETLPGTRDHLLRFMDEYRGHLALYRKYRNPADDRESYLMYLENPEELLRQLRRELAHSSDGAPVVVDWGPKLAREGEPFNAQPSGSSAMWFKLEAAEPYHVVRFGGTYKETTVVEESSLLTIGVDHRALEAETTYLIEVCNLASGTCAEPLEFPVVAAEGPG